MAADFYSAAAARRSLVHFAAGKAAAAVSGLGVLLLTLRLVPAEEFGSYIALMALTEIFYLVSGLGLSYFAQRYVPQLRIRASSRQFNTQLWRLLAMRGALACAFAVPMYLSGTQWTTALGLRLDGFLIVLFVANLVFGSVMRYIDELLQTLLLQGSAQLQSVVRNLVRLAALALATLQPSTIDLNFLLTLEVGVAVAAVIAGLLTFHAYTKSRSGVGPNDAPVHHIPDAWRQSLRFYGAQVLAQCYGANAVKLMVTTVIGVRATAALGFAYSIADLLRNYSPAFLLGGWIRPIMVARFVDQANASALKPITRLVVNISVLGLVPFALIFAIYGSEVTSMLSGGKYPEAAPLLAPLVGVVCLQAAHAVFGMVCATVERTAFVLFATTICLTTLPLAYVLTEAFGIAGTVAALMLSELMWIGTVVLQLARHFGTADFADLRGVVRALLIAALVSLPLALIHHHWSHAGPGLWLSIATVSAIAYWAIAWYANVLDEDQRALIDRFVKRKSLTAADAS